MSILSLILGNILVFCFPVAFLSFVAEKIIILAIYALISLFSLSLGLMGKTRDEEHSTKAIVKNGAIFGLALLGLIVMVFH